MGIIYADLECLLEKMHSCQNNPEKSYTEKKTRHTPSGYSLFTNCSFDFTKNKLDCYKSKYAMKSFCKDLRQHAMKIFDYEKNGMIKKKLMKKISLMKNKKFATYVKKNFILTMMIMMIMMTIKSIIKSEIIVIALKNLAGLLIIFVI